MAWWKPDTSEHQATVEHAACRDEASARTGRFWTSDVLTWYLAMYDCMKAKGFKPGRPLPTDAVTPTAVSSAPMP